MSKQSDGIGIVWLVGIGIVVAPFVLLYNAVGAVWFWVIILGFPILVLIGKHQQKGNKNQIETTASTIKSPALPMDKIKSAEKVFYQSASKKVIANKDPWLDHCIEIENAWDRGNYDWARMQLQKIAYGMVEPSVTDAQRADFTRLMTAFAKEDPLYKEVMERVRPMLRANPGMLQSHIYKGQPDDIKEQMRYVLYFANELGHINRVKKGNSYKLTLPGEVIEGEAR